MSLIKASRLRGLTRTVSILDENGATVTPGANDKVRAIIGRKNDMGGTAATPSGHKLLIVSGTPTANGSSITKGASNTLRIDAQDLSDPPFKPGAYTILFDYFDNADAQEWKRFSEEVFFLGE